MKWLCFMCASECVCVCAFSYRLFVSFMLLYSLVCFLSSSSSSVQLTVSLSQNIYSTHFLLVERMSERVSEFWCAALYVIHVDILYFVALYACWMIDTRLNRFFSSSVFSRHQTSNRVHCAFIELCVSQSMRVNKMCVCAFAAGKLIAWISSIKFKLNLFIANGC